MTTPITLQRAIIASVIALAAMFPGLAYAQVGTCGGVANVGFSQASCQPVTQQCASNQRVTGNSSSFECPNGSGDFYWHDIGGCVVDQQCANPAPTITFTANPATVYRGDGTSLQWSATNATACTSADFTTGGATSGSAIVAPLESRVYNLTCTNNNITSTNRSVTVTVTEPPFATSCSPNKTTAEVGESVTWTAIAWNGTSPYSFTWLGQLLSGLTGSSQTVSYTTPGTKTASVEATDSSSLVTGVQVQEGINDMCSGAVVANVMPGDPRRVEDGGTYEDMQQATRQLVRELYASPQSVWYFDQSSNSQNYYNELKTNPQNYCVSVRLGRQCVPQGTSWEGCNWSWNASIHLGTGKRSLQVSDAPTGYSFQRYSATGTGTVTQGVPRKVSNACSAPVTVSAVQAATASLSANPISIVSGASSTLTHSCTNATSATISGVGSVNANSGTVSVSPTTTTTYTLTCTNAQGSATASATVTVTAPSVVDLTTGAITPTTATAGTPVNLSATATNVGNATSGSFPLLFQIQSPAELRNSSYLAALTAGSAGSGSVSHTFATAGTYQVRACANFNTAWQAITTESDYGNNCGPWAAITVAAAAPSPSLTCTVSPQTPAVGGSVTYTASGASAPFTWTSSDGISFGSAQTAVRTFTTQGQYGMTLAKSGFTSAECPIVTVGAAPCVNPTGTLTATPNRIRPGATVSVAYTASGIQGSCTLTGPTVSQTIPASSCTIPNGSVTTGALTTQSTFILTCDGTERARTVVNVVPQFEEF